MPSTAPASSTTMLPLILPLMLASTSPALPPAHLLLGVRTHAIADTWSFVPDLAHTGGGFGIVAGEAIGPFAFRGGLDVETLDQGIGYCLEPCGYVGVSPPVRAVRQMLLTPRFDVRLQAWTIGPVGLVVIVGGGFPIGTSRDGGDPLTIGMVSALGAGVVVDIGDHWRFDTAFRSELGSHLVPGSPERGYTNRLVVEAAFVYRFDAPW